MEEFDLFGQPIQKENKEKRDLGLKYTKKIEQPLYEPKNKKPHLLELYNNEKSKKLIKTIDSSNVSDEEKFFLKVAAYRHVIFDYEKIADYYSNSNKEMQELMEQSALVIVDFNSAIENGYIKMCKAIEECYINDYEK